MIDIFLNEGPHFMETFSFWDLAYGCLEEIGKFSVALLLSMGLFLVARRIRQKSLRTAIFLLMPAVQLLYVWTVSIRSEFFFSFMFALMLTLVFRVLELIPLTGAGYLFLFSALLFPSRLFNSTSVILGHLWLFWVIFCACFLAAKLDLGHLHGNHFSCYVLFTVLSLLGYTVYLAMSFLMPHLEELLQTYSAGLIGTITLLMAVFLPLAYVTRRLFRSKLLQLNQFGRRYQKVEGYFPWFSVLILGVCTLVDLPFTAMSFQNPLVRLLFPCLCITLLGLQIPFLFLLFQVAFYKDTVALGQREKEGLVAYYQDLTANLDTLQGIRHDMKNIFFTMGGFVDRSEDEEMKAFYWEKIYPYSQNAIHQSELLSAAYQLPDETLRAFFYLKLSQAVQRQVPVSLSVHILPEQFQLGIDLIDLTRILGILLDNAIEETAKISKGMVEVQIAGDGETISYTIKNPITEQTKRSGVHPGQTTKGAGHGRGLLIVRQILEQYDHAVLNACIQTNKYIQSLNIDVRHNLSE